MAGRDPIIISEATPLIVGDLTVYPDRLQYRETRCNFRDIQHIGWYWLSQTINFLNTQQVRFTLHVRGLPHPITISKITMYVTPKLVTAYNYIAQETFQSRLSQYTDQLEEHGAFTFQGCTFYSDGRILSNGNAFNVQDAEFGPFQMTAKQGGFLGPRLKVDLITDRDVIVSLLMFILKNPKNPSDIKTAAAERRRTREAADQFLVDVISMLAKIASADGHVTAEEIRVIKDFAGDALRLSADKMKMVVDVFQSAIDAPEPLEVYAHSFHRAHRTNQDLLQSILDLLFSVASADNVLSAEEELLLLEAEEIFGVPGPAFAAFRAQRQRRQHERRREPAVQESEFLRVLGLSANAQPAEIKARYRRLVMQYHPDRVHHLGHAYREEAEKKMKDINVAYDFFSRKYAF